MSTLICPQCHGTSSMGCDEEGCPGLHGFIPREERSGPDRKMLETMGARIADLETLVLTIADGSLTGAVILPLSLREVVDGEAGKIRKGGKEGTSHGC